MSRRASKQKRTPKPKMWLCWERFPGNKDKAPKGARPWLVVSATKPGYEAEFNYDTDQEVECPEYNPFALHSEQLCAEGQAAFGVKKSHWSYEPVRIKPLAGLAPARIRRAKKVTRSRKTGKR